MNFKKGTVIFQDKEYDDVYGFNNEKAKSLNNSIDGLKTELDNKIKELKQLQSDCSHTLYLTSKGVVEDTFRCSECGFRFSK